MPTNSREQFNTKALIFVVIVADFFKNVSYLFNETEHVPLNQIKYTEQCNTADI